MNCARADPNLRQIQHSINGKMTGILGKNQVFCPWNSYTKNFVKSFLDITVYRITGSPDGEKEKGKKTMCLSCCI